MTDFLMNFTGTDLVVALILAAVAAAGIAHSRAQMTRKIF